MPSGSKGVTGTRRGNARRPGRRATNARLRESARLPEREKRIVLGIARQFGEEFIHSLPCGKCLQHSFLALPVALQAPRAARWDYSCW